MPADSSRLQVQLLGPPDIRIDGAPVRADTRKAIALLAYLAERDTAPTRDELVWLLWPDSTVDRGRGALRRTISALRSALGGRWVEADRERVHLDRTGLDLDTARLDEPGGIDLARGRFLEGFHLRDAAEFDDWQAVTAEHYDRRLRTALEARATERLAGGDARGAVADAERRLAIDPLDESSHRLLMHALAAAGDRAGAVRQYRACVAMLEDELAVEPLPETVELHEAILAGELTPAPTPVTVPDPTPATHLVDVGHGPLVDRLRRAVGAPGATRVTGPAGSGRTTLAAAALPAAVHVAAYPADADLPHSLTRSILSALAEESDAVLDERAAPAVHVAPILARRAPEPPPLDDDLAAGRLLDGITTAVRTLLGDRVLVIDDVEAADVASAAVVERLVGRAGDLGIRIVTIVPDTAGAPIRTTPLEQRMVTDLAAEAGHGPEVADAVLDATGGWVGPVLEALATADPLAAVAEQRAKRVRDLDPVARQVLEALAVLGAGGPTLVATVAGRPVDEVADALDRLVATGLVGAGDRLEPVGWAATAATDNMGSARATLLHGRAADARAGDPAAVAARARHLERAGRTAEASATHAAAAEAAAAVLAPHSVREHVEAALALGHTDPGHLHRLLGEAETRAGNYPAAIRSLHAAAANGTSWEVERSIGDVYLRWGRWPLATASFEAALDLADDDAARATVLADLAVVAARSGDAATARDRVAEALAVEGDDPEVVSRVENVAGLVLDAPEHLVTAITHARRTDRREDEAAALNNLALAYARRDRVEEGIALAERALGLLDRSGDRHRRAAIHGNLADLHHLAGAEDASQAHLREAVTLFAEVGVGEWEPEIWKLTGW
ncbi:MAG: BTAD domain-containing putative transcriptional regulator [Acidimicrobiia bacterium]